MEKLKMHSPNLTQDNIARIRDLFPGCVTEAKGEDGSVRLAVDFDQLRQELAESIVEGPQERYHLNWPGKREALLAAYAPIAKTLRPCRDESVDFDTTKNLFIEGDNLDALKLLQETYLGKVKMIYIDPPYNTGNDFIYEDDFTELSDAYLTKSNQQDELGRRLRANTESNGRFHSNWLSMVYARLRIARAFLEDSGVIFISIDDGEQANLRKVCDEVFGESNFVSNIIWQKKYAASNDAKYLSDVHDFILCYAKNKDSWRPNLFPRSDELNDKYSNPDNDPRGPWYSTNLSVKTYSEKNDYIITSPAGIDFRPPASRCWVVSKEKYNDLLKDNRIWFGKDGTSRPYQKKFLSEVQQGVVPTTIWFHEDAGHNIGAKSEIRDLFSDTTGLFDTPKPTKLIRRLMDLCFSSSQENLVLDFFAGSATTAHALFQRNAELGRNDKFILVQIPESMNDASDAFKSGYRHISSIAMERIRRAGAKIKQESALLESDFDIGFRVLKIDASNMADVYYAPDALDKANFDLFVDNIKPDRTPEDLLFQVMLDWGVDLALPITKQSIQGKEVFFVDGNVLAACFDSSGSIDEAFVKELAKHQPLRVVFRDAGYKNSAVKINVEQIFKLLSPATEVKCI